MNRDYPKEDKYFKIGSPIRVRFNYLPGKKFLMGLTAYTNLNSKVDLYGFMLNFGYRF